MFFTKPNYTDGQAAISLVFLVGGTVLLIGVTLTFLVVSFINTTFAYRAANRALGVAIAGVNDALLQLSRNRGAFLGVSCEYDLKVGDVDYTHITVANRGGLCGQVPPGSAQIVSESTVLGRTRRVEVTVFIDRSTGKIAVTQIKQKIFVSGGGCTGGFCP